MTFLSRLMERHLFKFRFTESQLRAPNKEARDRKHEELKELVKKWDIAEELLPPALLQMLKDPNATSASASGEIRSSGGELNKRPLSSRSKLKEKILEERDTFSITPSRKAAFHVRLRYLLLPATICLVSGTLKPVKKEVLEAILSTM